ncbi:hypothetical protein QQG55_56915 [Brugia pahangi]
MLQTVWKELGVKKGVPVERLLRCKFQQFRIFAMVQEIFDANYDGRQYDALRARNNEPLPASWTASSRPVPSKAHKIARNNSFAHQREESHVVLREYELMIQELKENVRILRNQRHFYHDKVRKLNCFVRMLRIALLFRAKKSWQFYTKHRKILSPRIRNAIKKTAIT